MAKERKQWPGEYINRGIPCQKKERQRGKRFGKARAYITGKQEVDFCGIKYVISKSRSFEGPLFLFARHGCALTGESPEHA